MSTRSNFLSVLQEARGGWAAQDFSKRTLIPEKRLAILCDLHIPYHDEKMLAGVLDMCKSRGTEAIVWLGDVFDMHLFSSWGVTDQSTRFRRELDIFRAIARLVDNLGMKQYWSSGNHEERWLRKNNYHVGIADLAYIVGLSDVVDSGALVCSDSPTLEAFDGRWMLTHPAQFSATPLVVPGRLATLNQKHVLSAHAHHFGAGMDSTGKFRCIEGGCLLNPDACQYYNYRVTTHRAWVPAFWTLEDGVPVGFLREDVV